MSKQSLWHIFEDPGAEWRGKPFWSWNGELREDEVRRQINIMKEMGLGGYFMHSRAGLITEYLGEDWFDLINAGADEGESIGMEAWLYDEDRWPSGSAGGKVTVDAQYSMKSVVLTEEAPETFARTDDMRFVFLAKIGGIDLHAYRALSDTEDIRSAVNIFAKETADKPGNVRILSFAIVPDKPESNYNGTTYIDTMSRAAVDRFIELTHEQYKAKCGDRLGRSIKGIFTDEPHRGEGMGNRREENGIITCSVCWTNDFFDEFVRRYGYRAEEVLPELFYRPDGERFAPVKHDWFDLADNLFLERFAKPINDWCIENGIDFTGHVLHEDSLTNQSCPHGSLMRFYEYMGAPGVDVLSEYNRCYWIVKQLSSAARQLGKKWLLSELYGCTGWQFNFKSHKAVGDWQALFGINLRCQHLSWYTMEGESKRDYPASILHQSPWYPYYNDVETYFARFGAFMTEGSPVCDVLVLNPIESAWSQSYLGWANWIFTSRDAVDVQRLEEHYTRLFHMLIGNHIDFDYGEEQMMEQHASVRTDENGAALLCVGNMTYRTVVVSGLETIRPTTLRLLGEFAALGGKIIFAGDAPAYINAVRDSAPADFAREHGICIPFDENALISAVRENSFAPITVSLPDGKAASEVFVQMRSYGDSIGFVLLNTDRDNPTDTLTVRVKTAFRSAELWDLSTGERYAAECSSDGETLTLQTTLPAAGTAAFILTEQNDSALPALPGAMSAGDRLIVRGTFAYETNEQNVCVLDFARFRFNGGEWSDEAEILRIDGMVRDRIGIERRGGGMLQPWYAKLHDKTVYGKVELQFTFDIDTLPEGDLILAGERPERMHYAINGVPLQSLDIHDFWIDDCFKKMVIPHDALKLGTNVITAETDFMRTTNLEALYLIGDFGVALDGRRRTLIPCAQNLQSGDLARSGMPFYTGEVTYILTPDMYTSLLSVSDNERVMLSPEDICGSLIRVSADDGNEIRLIWDPYTADVTDAVRAGKDIRVTVVGTRRNLFGPLHFAPRFDGSYGPGHFVTEGDAWTDDYALIQSGLGGIVLQKYKI